MVIHLPLPHNFSFDRVVRSHGWYDLPPFVYDPSRGELTTCVATRRGPAGVRFRANSGRLVAESDRLDRAALQRIATRVFSLDLDLGAFHPVDAALRRDLSRGSGRMLRAPSAWEDAVKMLFTTNCGWSATRGMVVRLIALAGPGGRAFPLPDAVARIPPSTLAREVRCGYRAPALSRLARRIASGRLDLSSWEDPNRSSPEVREAILAEHGFGPYAAEGLLRIFGRHDFLALDSWVRGRYRRLHPGAAKSTDRSIARRYARHGPYRGLALWLEMTRHWHEE